MYWMIITYIYSCGYVRVETEEDLVQLLAPYMEVVPRVTRGFATVDVVYDPELSQNECLVRYYII